MSIEDGNMPCVLGIGQHCYRHATDHWLDTLDMTTVENLAARDEDLACFETEDLPDGARKTISIMFQSLAECLSESLPPTVDLGEALFKLSGAKLAALRALPEFIR